MGERGQDASSGGLERDCLSTEVDVVWSNVAIGRAGSIHSRGESSEMGGAIMEEVWLTKGEGVTASATVALGGKSRRGRRALVAAASSVLTVTAILP